MSLTIEFNAETTWRLRELAAFAGMEAPEYVRHIVEEKTRSHLAPASLSQEEIALIEKINHSGVALTVRQRYQDLRDKMRAEAITNTEHAELLSLIEKMEAANVERLSHLVQLAQLRQVSLPEVMLQLGLKPPAVE